MKISALFLLVGLISPTFSIAQEPEQTGNWYYRAAVDPITDVNSSTAMTMDDDEEWGLGIQCFDGGYRVGIMTNSALLHLKIIGETWRPTMTWRIDKNEPVMETWIPAEYGLGIVDERAVKFVEAVILAKSRIVMRFGHSAATYTVILPADGAADAIGALNDCNLGHPGLRSIRDRAAMASMKIELRNLRRLQESYFTNHGTYGSTVEQINLTPFGGVTIELSEVSRDGYRGTARHANLPNVACYIEIGSAWQRADGTYEGAPWCDDRRR